MSNHIMMPQNLGTVAPVPGAPTLIPQALPTNFMVPGFHGMNGSGGSSILHLGIAFVVGAVAGGFVVLKMKRGYKMLRSAADRIMGDEDEEE